MDLAKLDWLYETATGRRGPISAAELVELARSGAIDATTPVSFDRGASWRPYAEHAAALESPPPPPVADGNGSVAVARACALCGRSLPESELLRYGDQFVCADCKPQFVQRLRAGQALVAGVVYAGFWIRVAAKLIDGMILYAVNLVFVGLFSALLGGKLQSQTMEDPANTWVFFAFTCGLILVQALVAMAYTVYFLVRYAGTPGKLMLKLRVVRSDGSALSLGRAFGRHFGDMLSSMILGIGYLMVAWDEQKRALHDQLCDTRVVQAG